MPVSAIATYSNSPLIPAFPEPKPIELPFQVGNSLTIAKGAVLSVKTSDGKLYAYAPQTFVTPPTTPVFVGAGTGGTWPADTYPVAVSFVNPQGETPPCPAVNLTLTATQSLRVPAITGIDATVTKVRVYVGGHLASEIAVAALATVQTDIATYSTLLGGISPQSVNSAGKISDGTQVARGVSAYDFVSDASGKVSFGTSNPGEFGQTYPVAPIFLRGYFNTADLTGLDATSVAQLGRLVVGTTVAGIISIG